MPSSGGTSGKRALFILQYIKKNTSSCYFVSKGTSSLLATFHFFPFGHLLRLLFLRLLISLSISYLWLRNLHLKSPNEKGGIEIWNFQKFRPIFDQFLTNFWPIFDQFLINFWPIFDQFLTNFGAGGLSLDLRPVKLKCRWVKSSFELVSSVLGVRVERRNLHRSSSSFSTWRGGGGAGGGGGAMTFHFNRDIIQKPLWH